MTDLDIEDLKAKAKAAANGLGVMTDATWRPIDWSAVSAPSTILALIAEIDRCHARLEIDRVWHATTGGDVPKTVPYAERGAIPDGIEARDDTIKILDRKVKAMIDRVEKAEAKLSRTVCMACGSVSSNGECDCTRGETGTRRAISEADCDVNMISDAWKDNARLRALLARAGEALRDAIEGSDVAVKLAENIRERGNYTADTMVTFLGQIPIGGSTRTVTADIEKEIGDVI